MEVDDVNEMLKAASEIQDKSARNDHNTVSMFEAMQIACLMESNRVLLDVSQNICNALGRIANVIEGT